VLSPEPVARKVDAKGCMALTVRYRNCNAGQFVRVRRTQDAMAVSAYATAYPFQAGPRSGVGPCITGKPERPDKAFPLLRLKQRQQQTTRWRTIRVLEQQDVPTYLEWRIVANMK
jgi:hypothetical protein